MASTNKVLTLTQKAVSRLRELTSKNGKYLRVGVKSRGCAGFSYTMDYVDSKSRFDEEVVQDDVKVLIDSKALLTLIGTEMDYAESSLSNQFIFNNPNVKDTCGCGQSFMV